MSEFHFPMSTFSNLNRWMNWAVTLATIALATAQWSSAAVDPFEDDLRRFDFEIEKRTIRAVDKMLEPKALAAKRGVEWPILPPRLKYEQVEQKVEAELNKVLDQTYPESRYRQIRDEAEKIYRVFKIGEQITILIRMRGAPHRWDETTGRLQVVTLDKIKIGGDVHARRDVYPDDLPHFYLDEHEAAIKKYTTLNTAKFETDRTAFAKKHRLDLEGRIWPQYGYLKSQKQPRWMPIEDVFQLSYKRTHEKVYNEKRPDMKTAVYNENGYYMDGDTNQWLPPDDSRARLSAMQKLVVFFRSLLGFGKHPEPDVGSEPRGTGDETLREDDSLDVNLWEDDGGTQPAPKKKPTKGAPREKKMQVFLKKPAAPADDVSDLFDE